MSSPVKEKLEQTPLELIECIDMMPVLEHNLPVQLVHTEQETIGVYIPIDLKRAEQMLRRDPIKRRYLETGS